MLVASALSRFSKVQLVAGLVRYSQGFFNSDHLFDAIVHVLDKLNLTSAETTSVGDVVGAVVGLGVLTVGTADLHVELVGNSLEPRHVSGKLGELNVDGGAEGSAEVGGARGDVTQMFVMSELDNSLNVSSSAGKAVEDGTDVSTLLHGDDTELVLFIHPHEEGLGIVVEDTTATGPVAVETASLKETVTLLEEEMVIDELLLVLSGHTGKGVEGTLEVTFEGVASLNDISHNLVTLVFGFTGAKREVSKVAADTDTGRVDHSSLILGERGGIKIGRVHVGNVGGIGSVAMVVLDNLVEEIGEGLVRVVGASIAANTGVDVLATGKNALFEGDTARVRYILVLVPIVLRQKSSNS